MISNVLQSFGKKTSAHTAFLHAVGCFLVLAVLTGFSSSTTSVSAQTSPTNQNNRPKIVIGTGGPAGVYFVAGNSICRMVRLSSKNDGPAPFGCAAPPSGGSLDNLNRLESGEIDFAIVQSDWNYHAYNGTSLFKNRKQANLRSVFSLHVEPFQIIAGATSGVKSWDDLAGKRVNIGNIGSGHRATFEDLIAFHGVDAPTFKTKLELGSSKQASALCGNSIDAFAFMVGVPNASIAAATDGCDGQIVDLDTLVVKKLIDRTPYYRWAKIPAGTYYTTDKDIKTFGVVATLVTRADVQDESVDRIVRSVMENLEKFKTLHPALAELSPQLMATSGLSAPLHKAARRRFQLLGLLK